MGNNDCGKTVSRGDNVIAHQWMGIGEISEPDLELIPSEISESVKNLMIQCWDKDPTERPTFIYICDILKNALNEQPRTQPEQDRPLEP